MAASARLLSLAAGMTAALAFQGFAIAEDAASASADATLADIEKTWGFVPSFIRAFPSSALPGAWAELKALESEDSALSAKEKALVSVGVSAQVPCQYCVWLDTRSAYLAGATDEEIQEAIAMAAVVRHWSTILNGNQVDFEMLKQEFAEFDKAAMEMRRKTMAGP